MMVLEICFMCESSRRSWLIITQKCVILVLDVNEMPSSVGRWLDVILNCLGPTSITSVLSELRSRKLLVIQDFTSCRQVSILGKCTISSRSEERRVGKEW